MIKTFQFNYTEYSHLQDTPSHIQKLMECAQKAREKAYAPYSEFLVGAAIIDNENNIYTGNNQENAAYPSGLCAERVAIFHAASQLPSAVFTDMAISVRSLKKKIDYPTAPCGACRQVLAEYENNQSRNIRIFFMGEEGPIIEISSVKELLPFIFNSDSL